MDELGEVVEAQRAGGVRVAGANVHLQPVRRALDSRASDLRQVQRAERRRQLLLQVARRAMARAAGGGHVASVHLRQVLPRTLNAMLHTYRFASRKMGYAWIHATIREGPLPPKRRMSPRLLCVLMLKT